MIATNIIAHRGLSSLCPENTLIAMEAAKKVGATWVEADVQILQDGTPVIIHDHDLSRTTSEQGLISDVDLADIQDLDNGTWFDERFHAERIPTLRTMFEHLFELDLGLMLEIKYHPRYHDNLSAADQENIITHIMKGVSRGPKPPRGIILTSFFRPFLTLAREYDSTINLGCLYSNYNEDYIDFAKSIGAVSVNVSKEMLLEPEQSDYASSAQHEIKAMRDANLDIYAYTVNTDAHAQKLFELGIDGILTDYPQNFPRWLP